MRLSQTYKDFRRLQQIANVLFKQELGYFVNRLNLKSHLTFKERIQLINFAEPKDSLPRRLRMSMEELSGSFVKLGQLLSLRPDLIPPEYADEFSKLQDSVKPFPFENAKIIIESELKQPINNIFSHFNKEPIAAASVGQVYEAILKNGKRVAVKVQRPKIKETFEVDIDLMYHIAHLLEKHMPESKNLNPSGIVEEFERYTKKEMDYIAEARNIDNYRVVVEHEKHVIIPKVYWKYTTPKVLTMEFLDGIKISSISNFRRLRIKKSYLSSTIVRTFVNGILHHRLFHADPHPGNILIMKNNDIALLDFGIVGTLTPELAEKIGNLYFGLVTSDVESVAEGLISIGFISEDVNKENFKEDIRGTWGEYYNISLNKIEMISFLKDTIKLGRKYNMRFPTEFILLIKAIITTEGVIQKMDPIFNFVEASRPIFKRYFKGRSGADYMLESAKKTIMEFKNLLSNFPRDVQKILTKLEKEEKKELDINDEDVKKFTQEIEKSTKRMTIGVIFAALLLASSLLILAKTPPYLWGLPLYSIICIIIAGVLFIILLRSILKN